MPLQGYCIPFIYLHSQFMYFLSYNCTTSSLCDLPTLKKEALVSYSILVSIYQTTRCDTPGECNNNNTVKPQLYICLKYCKIKGSVKSGKNYSYGHLARAIKNCRKFKIQEHNTEVLLCFSPLSHTHTCTCT